MSAARAVLPRRVAIARGWWLGPLALACAPAAELGVPTGAGTVLVARVDDPTTLAGLRGLLLRGSSDEAVDAIDERWNLALAYERTPEELGWRLGPIAHDPAGSSRLRRPDAVYARADDGAWRPREAPGALADVRVAWPEDRCGAGPLCVEGGLCAPCGARAAVAEPAPPRPWPTAECPTGMQAASDEAAGETIRSCTVTATACGPTRRRGIDGRCARVGAACAGRWPIGAPPGAVFASDTGRADAAGTPEDPLDLGSAIDRAGPSGAIALSTGVHRLSRLRAVSGLYGACAAETTLALGDGPALDGGAVALHDLGIEGPLTAYGSRVELAGVLVRGRVFVLSSTLTAHDGVFAGELDVLAGSRFEGREIQLEEGVFVDSGARIERFLARTLTASTASVELSAGDLHPAEGKAAIYTYASALVAERLATQGGLYGLYAERGSSELTGLRVEDTVGPAILLREGHRALVRELVAHDVQAGLTVSRSEIQLEHALVADSFGVTFVFGADTETRDVNRVRLADLRVLGAIDDVLSFQRGELQLERVVVEGAAGSMFDVHGDLGPAVVTVSDLRLRGVREPTMEVEARPNGPVTLSLARISIDRVQGYGLGVRHGPATVHVEDLWIGESLAWSHWTCPPERGVPLCDGSALLMYHRREVGGLDEPIGVPMTLSLERFDVAAEVAGLAIGADVELEARDGRVRAEIGAVIGGALDWRDVLSGVELDARELSRFVEL